jgi:hypothetical protein
MNQFLIIYDGAQCDASVSEFGVAEHEVDENSGTVTRLPLLISALQNGTM